MPSSAYSLKPALCFVQTNDLETNVLGPLHAWIKEYRTFKDKLSSLDNRRLEFDAERRAFHKLELKKVHQQQATDKAEPELMGKLEAKSGDVAGTPWTAALIMFALRVAGSFNCVTHSCATLVHTHVLSVLGIGLSSTSAKESMSASLC